jgi:hypothetical protein
MFSSVKQIFQSLNPHFPPSQIKAMLQAMPVQVAARSVADQSVTTSTAEVNTALSVDLQAGKAYAIEVFCPATIAVTQGMKIDFNGGTCTATSIVGRVAFLTDNAAPQYEAITALNTSVNSIVAGSGVQAYLTIVVNAPGTLVMRFAQQASGGGTATIAAGSRIVATELP